MGKRKISFLLFVLEFTVLAILPFFVSLDIFPFFWLIGLASVFFEVEIGGMAILYLCLYFLVLILCVLFAYLYLKKDKKVYCIILYVILILDLIIVTAFGISCGNFGFGIILDILSILLIFCMNQKGATVYGCSVPNKTTDE